VTTKQEPISTQYMSSVLQQTSQWLSARSKYLSCLKAIQCTQSHHKHNIHVVTANKRWLYLWYFTQIFINKTTKNIYKCVIKVNSWVGNRTADAGAATKASDTTDRQTERHDTVNNDSTIKLDRRPVLRCGCKHASSTTIEGHTSSTMLRSLVDTLYTVH